MSRDGHAPGRDVRLRVAFVVPNLEVGGLQRAISTIAHNLDPQRAVMDVIALRRPSEASTVMYDELGAAGVAVHDLRVQGRAERDPRALVSAVAGLLAAPAQFVFTPTFMQVVIIYAFAAAVLGGIESPVGAVIGGLALGVAINLLGTYFPGQITPDMRLPVALAVLLVVLVFRPAGLLGRTIVRRV